MINKIYNLIRALIYRLLYTKAYIAKKNGVKIGEGTVVMDVTFGSEPYLISIGNNCQITDGVKFFTHGGAHVFRVKDPKFDYFGRITIGNNVYVGNNVLIMPGVTIGSNVLIGAGSIVTKSVPDNTIIAGAPARIIKSYDQYYDELKRFNVQTFGCKYEDKKNILLELDDEMFIKR